MKQGMTLTYPIMRQFPSGSSPDTVEGFSDAFCFFAALCLILVIPVFTTKAIEPVWVFLHSLQVITHLILLNTLMPANAQLFLRNLNDIVRWHDPNQEGFVAPEAEQKQFEHQGGTGPYTTVFISAGYSNFFVANLSSFLIVIAIVLVIAMVVSLREACKRWQEKRQRRGRIGFAGQRRKRIQRDECCTAACCQNFILRLLLFFFLELWICAILQVCNTNFEADTVAAGYIMAIASILILLCLMGFAISTTCRRGPYTEGFLAQGTLCMSFLKARPRDIRF